MYLARVEANLARAEELVAANAELLAARLSLDQTVRESVADRLYALRMAERRALEFAAIHRGRGQMGRAQFHEAAAEWLSFVADAHEEPSAADLARRELEAEPAGEGDGSVREPVTAEVGAA